MRISDTHRLLFVHVQKTGGSTVSTLLDEHLPDPRRVRGKRVGKHLTLGQILRREPDLADYWTFGFVRNPWDRMVSWWTMIQERRAMAESSAKVARQMKTNALWRGVAAYPDFATFLTRGTQEFRELRTPQVRYLTTPHGRRADFIGRQETFEADMRAVLTRFGLPLLDVSRRRNVSRHAEYAAYYTPELRDLVGEVFSRDLQAFNYDF